MYEAVAPDDFESMLDAGPLRQPLDRLRQDHLRHPRPFLGSARQEIHRLRRALRHGERGAAARGDDRRAADQLRLGDAGRSEDADPLHQRSQTLRSFSSILHGEQGALNLSASLCHVLYDQGAQEYAANQTREEARHVTAFAKYIKARWGRPVPLQPGAAEPAGRDHLLAGGLQEDRRHADAGRGPGHGRLRHLLPEAQRPARPQADAAGDDRRGLPPQVREDLGRPHHPEADRGRAQHHRGLGGALLPDPAVQPRRPVRAARPLRGVRPRPRPGDRRVRRDRHRRSTAART